MFIQILHDFPDLSGATERDWVLPIQLSVVPVHFCQSEDFPGQKGWALLRTDDSQLKWLRDVHSWIGLVVPD